SEVAQRRLAEVGVQDVRRFDVPMKDPRAVRSLQGAGHFHAESKYLIRWQGAEFVDPCVQRTGAVILHDQIRITALSFADVQPSDNVRVTGEHAHRALLPDEAFPVLI